uniref:OTU domain-containing protein 4 n=1 Tax=Pelusios castaneus TaxID=367368 RepID=A0A8C8R966_9SAUR
MEVASIPDGGEQSHPGSAVEAPGDTSMDSCLRSQGLYRKRVAKDGSCLFRAVAEQVLHSQCLHIDVRNACINYLRENREKFEAFIEGPFEEYLKCLENPQEWVGQVEISALSLMYKKDFIIYQEPNASPSHVTENGFPDKVLLCFSNGNHYDIVYPIEYSESAALCQSLLYELLYEKVFSTDVNKILEELDAAEENYSSSEVSDSESEDDNYKSKTTTVNDMNGLKSLSRNKHLKNNGNPTSFLPRKVLKALNPSVYRNVEYEVWLQTKRDQQKRDFSIAAGMQYSVGDKCKVRLGHNGEFYNAHIQEVCSENGPVVVFVEELGAKHSVSLKSLKPLPQASPMEGWNTVSGKKMKKFSPACGQNVQPDVDHRGPKNQSKPIKAQSQLPPRQQYGVGTRHQFSCPGSQSQQTSTEHKTPGRNPSQPVRKPDRERAEDLDHTNRDCNYFGLSPEERREKQAIEESRSLYEIQQRDEQAFPALSNHSVCQAATQTVDTCIKLPAVTERRSSRWKADVEERKNKDSNSNPLHFSQESESHSSEKNGGNDKYPTASSLLKQGKTQSQSPAEQTPTEHLSCVNPTPPPVFSDVNLPLSVPSIPAIVPAWPNEPIYGSTGIPTQISVSSLMPAPTTGPDSVVSQATSPPVAGVPVSIQGVNQPLMPLPQTLNPYQDPLFPGFPFNEKGERAIAPPYSLCNTGDDLPKDKSILRFFFNLGLKAYSCPMWAPHSYLYPLHQAYLASCRMYPKVSVPLYPHNPWFQEAPPTLNENETIQTDRHFPMQNEVRSDDQSLHINTRSPSLPLIISTAQVSEGRQVCVESENPVQALQSDQDESLRGKNMFMHPPFGHNQFLGAVPIAPPFFPHFWYGYPFQGFMENSVVRPNVMSSEDKEATVSPSANIYLAKESSSSVPVASCVEHLQKAVNENNSNALPLPVASLCNECDILNETTTRMPKMDHISPAKQGKATLQNHTTQLQGIERQALVSSASPSVTEPPKNELKSNIPGRKEKPEKARDSKATDNLQTNLVESKAQRTREESSEDEKEVSDILKSGRSKQFYNQTYGGGRRPKSEWGYPSSRGGYQYPRNEEAWKGPPNRSREEGYQYHRNFRGRPYRHDRRRATMGDNQRGNLA